MIDERLTFLLKKCHVHNFDDLQVATIANVDYKSYSSNSNVLDASIEGITKTINFFFLKE